MYEITFTIKTKIYERLLIKYRINNEIYVTFLKELEV